MSGRGAKSVRFALRAVFCGLSTLALLTSCGGGGSGSIGVSIPPPISVTVNPPTATFYGSGETQTFTATVANDPSDAGVTWSVDDNCGMLIKPTKTSVIYEMMCNATVPQYLRLYATSNIDPTKFGVAVIYI
jgi:hypothetical protein